MNRKSLLKIAASTLAVLSMTTTVSAKGFTKTQEYKDGQFTDVPAKQWYAAEVKSAYELGFMNGQSDTTFAPDGNVTVAEGITMASRVHANYNGKEIKAVTGGKWYDMYIAYAVENGLIKEGQFANYDRNIMRYEMAVMFANAMPADYFSAKNDIKDIPDVAETEDYYDELMMLYKAGVVLGSDDYGNFFATNPIKRSETAAIINRVALPENRKEGKLLEYGNREQAVYLIRDDKMTAGARNKNYIASGWMYHDPEIGTDKRIDYSLNKLEDKSTEKQVYAYKDVYTVSKGKVGFETLFTVTANGLSLTFEDSEGKNLFEIKHKNGKIYAVGKEEKDTGIAFVSGKTDLYVNFDMDERTAEVIVGTKNVGTFSLSDAEDLSRVRFATGVKEINTVTLSSVIMYMNYAVNDTFRFASDGDKPYGWNVSDNVVIGSMTSDVDTKSVKISGKGTAKKTFEKVFDKFIYETFVLVPEGQSVTVCLMNGDRTALSVDASNGEFTLGRTEAALATGGNKFIRKYNPVVWQLIRTEVDTNADTALIKINGKDTLTVPYTEDGADGIAIVANGSGDFWFDDIAVYNVFDYADYCPTPVPVNDDEWYSGMSVCSLWREGTHSGWDFVSPYEELTPIMGYYDEGLPEVADWEIKMMVEHGYDYQRFCWYHSGRYGSMKHSGLSSALHDGYFNAKYSDMLDFSIMYENSNNSTQPTADQFFNEVWQFWKDWYLTDDRYFCIDNKPVITIYYYSNFKNVFGGIDGVKAAVERMEKECIELGYDGLILYVSESSANAELNKELAKVGFDAKVAYHFDEPSYNPEYQKIRMNAEYDAGSLTFSATCGIGFNDIGWTETRSPLATPEQFKEILLWARDEYLPRYAKQGTDNWHSKSLLSATWNEYGEGHYLAPTSLYGFGYLDAHRQVFSSVAGKNDSKHFDAPITDNQKNRLGYLYRTKSVPMRRLYGEEEQSKDIKYVVTKGWNFENPDDCNQWSAIAGTTKPSYDPNEKALVGATTTYDGQIKLNAAEDRYFDAADAPVLHVEMKVEKGSADKCSIYFLDNTTGYYVGEKGAGFTIIADGEYHDYYLDLASVKTWSGVIKNIRFDPIDVIGKYYIKKIEFLKPDTSNYLTLNVDGVVCQVVPEEYSIENGKVYFAANPSTGFYSTSRFYYEWDRVNGKLHIETGNGHVFDFSVGSDKATVDGVEKKLDKKLELYDGVAVLPLSFIYDNAGIKYKVDGKTMTVELRYSNFEEVIAKRVANEFEFNLSGDFEDFKVYGGNGKVENGCLELVAVHNGTRFDPSMQYSKLNADTSIYKEIEVRVKMEFADPTKIDSPATMYFATDANPSLKEAMTVTLNYKNETPDSDGFYTLRFKMDSNVLWGGNVKTIRFDPANVECTAYVDYIRLIADPEYLEQAAKAAEQAEKDKAEMMKADEGAPFFIKNPDAEGIYGKEYSSGSSIVSIVNDDLNPGNKAFHITTLTKDKKSWSYFILPTRFKPGVTYKVEFDLRIVGDVNGKAADDVTFSANFRYNDYEKDGSLKEKKDHSVNPKPSNKASSEEGWKHYEVTHTVKAESPTRDMDFFCIYMNPIEKDGKVYNYQYMVDNFVVTVVE